VLSFKAYLFTKIVRFLLLQTVVSQDITRERFVFIPYLEKYDTEFTDDILRERWNITDEEWAFIDSKIKAVELINNRGGNE
jgi:site-specific DNA-methyltransferase (adenine-specific)